MPPDIHYDDMFLLSGISSQTKTLIFVLGFYLEREVACQSTVTASTSIGLGGSKSIVEIVLQSGSQVLEVVV